MALQEDGIALLKFGTDTVSGWIVDGITETQSSELLEVDDEDGDIISTFSEFGVKTVVSFDLIPKDSTAIPAVGDTYTYTSVADGSSKIRILNVERIGAKKDVFKVRITGNKYPGITIT